MDSFETSVEEASRNARQEEDSREGTREQRNPSTSRNEDFHAMFARNQPISMEIARRVLGGEPEAIITLGILTQMEKAGLDISDAAQCIDSLTTEFAPQELANLARIFGYSPATFFGAARNLLRRGIFAEAHREDTFSPFYDSYLVGVDEMREALKEIYRRIERIDLS